MPKDPSRKTPGKEEREARERVVSATSAGQKDGGQSGGGPYPNPHTGKKGGDSGGGYSDHGGSTEMPYHGTGQLGEQKTGKNPNSPTRGTGSGEKGKPDYKD